MWKVGVPNCWNSYMIQQTILEIFIHHYSTHQSIIISAITSLSTAFFFSLNLLSGFLLFNNSQTVAFIFSSAEPQTLQTLSLKFSLMTPINYWNCSFLPI